MNSGTTQDYEELTNFLKALSRALASERCQLRNNKTEVVYNNTDAQSLHLAITAFKQNPSANGFIAISQAVEQCEGAGVGQFGRELKARLAEYVESAKKELAQQQPPRKPKV